MLPTEIPKIISILLSPESEKYSDLTITCGERSFPVLRAVVCPQSEFFRKACDAPFKEAETRIINLPDDNPDDVARMISFLYRGGYEDSPVTTKPSQEDTPSHPAPQDSSPERGAIDSTANANTANANTDDKSAVKKQLVNIRMYALGEKYIITDLKKFASEKFANFEGSPSSWKNGASEILHAVYTTTPASDRGLRSLVANACATFMTEEDFESWEVLSEIPEAHVDILHAVILTLRTKLSASVLRESNANSRAISLEHKNEVWESVVSQLRQEQAKNLSSIDFLKRRLSKR